MRAFSHFSIRQKLLGLVLLASGLALVCVVGAAVLYEATTFRPRALTQLQQEAIVLEEVLQAPLVFQDADNAQRYLSTRRVIEEIAVAALYDSKGELFAQYRRPDAAGLTPTGPQPAGASFGPRELALWYPIQEGDRVLGHLYLLEDLPPLFTRLPQYSLMVGAVLLALTIVGAVLVLGVLRDVLRPLASLVDTTNEVTRHNDYRVRATVRNADELGQLAGAFNQMLETIGQRDAALHEASARIKTVFDATTEVAIIATDPQGVITVFNTGAERMLGYQADEVVGKGTPLIWHDSTEVEARSAELSRELGRPIQGIDVFVEPVRQGQHGAREWTCVHKNGSRLVAHLVVTAVRDEQGSISGFLGIASDISERKRTEEALASERVFTDAVMDCVPGLLYLYDEQGRLVRWNKRHEQVSGYSPEELLGRRVMDWFAGSPEDIARISAGLEKTLREGSGAAEGALQTKNGNRIPFYFTAVRLTIRGKSYFAGIGIDITERKRADEELRLSERNWRTTFDAIGDAVALITVDGEILKCNAAMEKLASKPAEEIIGRRCCEIMHHTANPVAGCPLVHARQTHRRESMDLQVGEQYFEVTVDPLFDAEGRLTSVVHIMSDITERKQAQRALEESQQLYGELVSSVPLGVYRFGLNSNSDTDFGFQYVSDRFCELTGLQRDTVKQDPLTPFRIVHPDEAEAFERLNRDAIRRRLPFVWEGRARIRGEVRWLRIESRPTVLPGQLPFWTGVLVDVTERHATDARIRQQAALLEASHDAIIVWDVSRGVQFMNPAAEELTGQRLDHARTQELSSILRPRSDLTLHAAIREVSQRGQWNGELTLRTSDDTFRTVASRWTTLPDAPGKPGSVLITCNDITETKRLENQYLRAQRLESVGTLASGVAHDLNNILSPIIMGVEMLNMNPVDEETRSLLATMKESALRGRDTVKQLLTFARGTETQKGPIQPRHLLKEITRLLRQTFPKNIQIYTDHTGSPTTVLADPSQLHQVLMNLCVNARDAMPEGGVLFLTLETQTLDKTSAKIHPKARPVSYVVFKVADSGTGIPPEIVDRIFDPFFTTKPQGKGTGLGLATVLGIVENHGGFLTVQSNPGQGTSFQVYLPASAATEKSTAGTDSGRPTRGQGELVLVVDDEPAILRMAAGVLQRAGYSALTATSASEALHLYEKHHDRIKAVLTDIMMPFGDGRQFIAMLYEQDPTLPIIAMSGLATSEFQQETLRRGARAFVDKPFNAEQLLAILSEVLKPDRSRVS